MRDRHAHSNGTHCSLYAKIIPQGLGEEFEESLLTKKHTLFL